MFRAAMLAVLAVFSELWDMWKRWLYRPSAPSIELYEKHIAQDIVFTNHMALHLHYPDESPAHLYPTDDLPPEQTSNYFRLLGLITDSGLQIDFSNMYTESYDTVNNESFHYFQITMRCNKKRRMLKMTKRNNVDLIYVVPEYSFDSERKFLYISDAQPWFKIYDLVDIFTEDDSRKWRFKTVARLKAEARRRKQKRLLAVMLASHPRLGEAAPMGKVNEDLLESIALLSLS